MLSTGQWRIEESSKYTHPLDVQLFADKPMFEMLGSLAGKQVLDIGCGNGVLLSRIAHMGATATGVDSSRDMIGEIQKGFQGRVCVGAAEGLPVRTEFFDAAICSLTINNLASAEAAKLAFQEAYRILKPGGPFVISVPHPGTLSERTRYRWTSWGEGQAPENLVPGEAFQRRIMGRDGTFISVVNYYWPKDVLLSFAATAGFVVERVSEAIAGADEIRVHSSALEPIFCRVPFFLDIGFRKRSRPSPMRHRIT